MPFLPPVDVEASKAPVARSFSRSASVCVCDVGFDCPIKSFVHNLSIQFQLFNYENEFAGTQSGV